MSQIRLFRKFLILRYSRTAIYLRLSLEDNGKKDGDSMENQQKMLLDYVVSRPYLMLVDTYMDNGYTGTDFSRPEFSRMMDDVKAGKINCIVVKDLSRLGRNYVEAGDYLEKVFPFLNVRSLQSTIIMTALSSLPEINSALP